jgi:hypothetical protein
VLGDRSKAAVKPKPKAAAKGRGAAKKGKGGAARAKAPAKPKAAKAKPKKWACRHGCDAGGGGLALVLPEERLVHLSSRVLRSCWF